MDLVSYVQDSIGSSEGELSDEVIEQGNKTIRSVAKNYSEERNIYRAVKSLLSEKGQTTLDEVIMKIERNFTEGNSEYITLMANFPNLVEDEIELKIDSLVSRKSTKVE